MILSGKIIFIPSSFSRLFPHSFRVVFFDLYGFATFLLIRQGEKKIDRFVDLNVRGAQRRVYSDLRIYRN